LAKKKKAPREQKQSRDSIGEKKQRMIRGITAIFGSQKKRGTSEERSIPFWGTTRKEGKNISPTKRRGEKVLTLLERGKTEKSTSTSRKETLMSSNRKEGGKKENVTLLYDRRKEKKTLTAFPWRKGACTSEFSLKKRKKVLWGGKGEYTRQSRGGGVVSKKVKEIRRRAGVKGKRKKPIAVSARSLGSADADKKEGRRKAFRI